MRRLKRVSRRRWKARALQGKLIPWTAIVEHALPGPWNVADYNREGYTSVRRRRKGVEWFQREVFISYQIESLAVEGSATRSRP